MKPEHMPSLMPPRQPPCPAPKIVPGQAPCGVGSAALLHNCLYHFVYIWTTFGMHFWMYPTRSEAGRVLFGYQWDGRVWRYMKIDHALIEGFY